VQAYLLRLAAGSRRSMMLALNTIAGILTGGELDAEHFPWERMRYEHAQAVRAHMATCLAPASVNHHLAALRGVLREAWRLRLIDSETLHRTIDVAAVRGTTLPRGRALSTGEIGALFSACATDASTAGARDSALLALLFGCGLRRAEAVALDVADFDPEAATVKIRNGKGNKQRIVHTANGTHDALLDWLVVRGSGVGPLFPSINKSGRILSRRLSDGAVRWIALERARAAGVKEFSPHDARRSFISNLLDAGVDISTAQQLAGHASVSTTTRYDRRGEATRRRAVATIHIPYRRAPSASAG
jgi:integrase